MRIALVNVAHPSIGSRIPDDHLPPLGLLAIGGPLIDDGHDVSLIDGDARSLKAADILAILKTMQPDAVLFGHSGSSSAQPIISGLAKQVRSALPTCAIIYGGVHPTYFWREILSAEPWVDAVVRGEGEKTTRHLISAIETQRPLDSVDGIAFVKDGKPIATPPAEIITDLDAYRVGWELVDLSDYSYWGGKRAVVVQFSRGCPHLCSYCGQRGFWTRWRHRDPVRFAKEIALLHRDYGVEVFNFADENPTSSRSAWKLFLEALIEEKINVTLVGSTRADDIVRDADILHLYKQAGFERFLLGTENTDETTLKLIRKGGGVSKDREAIRLLRSHNILSMATWVVGFEDEKPADLMRGLRQLLAYDPDQIQALYVTPHRWTHFYTEVRKRAVIETDRTKWDYKHQVLRMRHIRPWKLLLWVKLIEAVMQLRPRALRRWLWNPDANIRHAIRWYYRMGRRVWLHELVAFLTSRTRQDQGVPLEAFFGPPREDEEVPMALPSARPTSTGPGN